MYFVNTNVSVYLYSHYYLYSHMIVALGKDDEVGDGGGEIDKRTMGPDAGRRL